MGANVFISFKSGEWQTFGKFLNRKKGSFALFVPKFIFLPQKSGGGAKTYFCPSPHQLHRPCEVRNKFYSHSIS